MTITLSVDEEFDKIARIPAWVVTSDNYIGWCNGCQEDFSRDDEIIFTVSNRSVSYTFCLKCWNKYYDRRNIR